MTAYAAAPTAPAVTPKLVRTINWADRHPIVVITGLGVVIAALYMINLSASPDFTADEVLYTILGQHVVNFNALSVVGSPFLVHPPLEFVFNGVWAHLTGTASSSTLTTLVDVRRLNVLFSAATAVVTGVTARDLLPRAAARTKTLAGVIATLLVAVNGFMVSYGRMALLEPAAIAAGSVIVLVAHRMRFRPALQQVLVVGLLIGVGTLIKQTVIFAALAPLLGALLMRDRRRVVTSGAAVLVGGVIWLIFPLWAAINGNWSNFWTQQSVSIQRLFGLVHTSGVNLPHGSPVTQFVKTFALYASGYAILAVGALSLVVIVARRGLFNRHTVADQGLFLLVGYALLSYGFIVYSFGFGAGNQQFFVYSAPVSALLCVVALLETMGSGAAQQRELDAPDGPPAERVRSRLRLSTQRATASAVILTLLLAIGVAGWVQYYLVDKDDGTTSISRFISKNVTACLPINASGSTPRWVAALPNNPVESFRNGPDALQDDVHLFLLSPKDARYAYGNMSQPLADWITSHGRLAYQTASRSSEELQLWVVGSIPALAPGTTCAIVSAGPSKKAPAGEFTLMLAATLVLVGGAGTAAIVTSRRRSVLASVGGRTEPSDNSSD